MRVAHGYYIAIRELLTPLDHPLVEYVMQVDVR